MDRVDMTNGAVVERFAPNHAPDCPLVERIKRAHPQLVQKIVASRGNFIHQFALGRQLFGLIGERDFIILGEPDNGEGCPHV